MKLQFCTCLLILLSVSVYAKTEFNGVIAQNIIHTSDNNYAGKSDDSVAALSTEASLLGNMAVTDDLNLSGQLMYRHFGEEDEGLDVDFFMLDFHPLDRESWAAGVQLGRFKNAMGFYGKTRDIAPTRDSIVLPQSIYYEGWRDLQLSTDGINLYTTIFTSEGELVIELGYGKPRAGVFESSDLYTTTRDEHAYVYRILYEHNGGQWRFAFSGGDTQFDQSYIETDELTGITAYDPGHYQYNNHIYSAEYNGRLWSITAEFSRGEYKENYESGYTSGAIEESTYLQLRRRLSAKVDAFIRYDQYYPDISDKDGASYEAFYGDYNHLGYSRSYSLGFKWHYSQALDFMAEFHRTHGTSNLPYEDNVNLEDLREAWNMLAVGVSYQF